MLQSILLLILAQTTGAPTQPRLLINPVTFNGQRVEVVSDLLEAALLEQLLAQKQGEVIPASEVARLKPSLGAETDSEITRLLRVGQHLNATRTLSTRILQLRKNETPEKLEGFIMIEIATMEQGFDRDSANGFGSANLRTSKPLKETMKTVVKEALNDLQSNTLPHSFVASVSDRDMATLSKGRKSGYRVGQEGVLFRGHQMLLMGKITHVEANSATFHADARWRSPRVDDKVVILNLRKPPGQYDEGPKVTLFGPINKRVN